MLRASLRRNDCVPRPEQLSSIEEIIDDARNGRMIGTGEAGLRYALRFLVSIIFFIGFLIALGDPQRRTFHDKIAGTVVTRPARESWSIDDEVAAPPRA